MPLNVPSIADPRDPVNPVRDAYGWVSALSIDIGQGNGSLVVTVNTSAATTQAQPIRQLRLALGQDLGNGAKAPTLADLMGDSDFAAAYRTIAEKLDAAAVACLPELMGATPV